MKFTIFSRRNNRGTHRIKWFIDYFKSLSDAEQKLVMKTVCDAINNNTF